jgi:hypothetical protein
MSLLGVMLVPLEASLLRAVCVPLEVSLLRAVWVPLAAFVLVFFVIGQAGHDSALFLAAILVVNNQWNPMPRGSMNFLF